MDKRTIVLAVILFIVLVLGMFIFAYLNQSAQPETVTTPPKEETAADPYLGITRIDAKHFFIDGVHTFAGEITLPTPCDLLNTSAQVMDSYPETIRLDFTVINQAEFCATLATTQRFLITTTASEEAEVKAFFMDREVLLNLIPPAPGETPDNFELFIKG